MSKTVKKMVGKFQDSKDSYGVIGKETGLFDGNNEPLRVGDIVAYRFGHQTNTKIYKSFIVEVDDRFYVMGSVGTKIESHSFIVRIIPHELVNEEILRAVKDNVSIEEKRVKQMTLSEIEKKLGYPIEIVEDK